ncbi:hypothetical protein [Anaerohalosphaera lusitana]|uniref:hypothetical protein n=1 Tax=Anaerohalosphaera lusitana TaxID=1936003 RepID=UPI0011BA67AB|nr:hypothetical protein [Anaerohalosphaera lusitana]
MDYLKLSLGLAILIAVVLLLLSPLPALHLNKRMLHKLDRHELNDREQVKFYMPPRLWIFSVHGVLVSLVIGLVFCGIVCAILALLNVSSWSVAILFFWIYYFTITYGIPLVAFNEHKNDHVCIADESLELQIASKKIVVPFGHLSEVKGTRDEIVIMTTNKKKHRIPDNMAISLVRRDDLFDKLKRLVPERVSEK